MNHQTPPPPPVFYKNPGIAAVLSFVWMGLGQIYNGQLAKGVVFIVAYAISWVLWAVVIGMFLTPALWLYGIYDAYKSAQKKNLELQEMYSQQQQAAGGTPPPPPPSPPTAEPSPPPPAPGSDPPPLSDPDRDQPAK